MESLIKIFSSEKFGLLILSILSFVRGFSYLPLVLEQDRKPAHYLENMIQPEIWGYIWITLSIVCLIAMCYHKITPLAIGFVTLLYLVWGGSFFIATIVEGGRQWVSSINYLGVAALTLWATSKSSIPQNITFNFNKDDE